MSWFDDIFDSRRIDRTYILKGGSGTGKSTLMKRVAKEAEKKGAVCEYFYCSSDPSSLDGIIVYAYDGMTLAMLDGTAPHVRDPKYPGACDEIVNLGEYWCSDILKANRGDIIRLCERKSLLFKEAYAHFGTAGSIVRAQLDEAYGYTDHKKLDAAVGRLLDKRMHELKIKSGSGEMRIRGISALSTSGRVSFDTYSDSPVMFIGCDSGGTLPFLFDAVIRAAKLRGLSYDRAPMPLIPTLTEAVRLPELSISVVGKTSRSDARPLNMSRFVIREKLAASDRTRRRLASRAAESLVDGGLEYLSEVRRAHGELEDIYIRAMDFTRLESAADKLISRLGL